MKAWMPPIFNLSLLICFFWLIVVPSIIGISCWALGVTPSLGWGYVVFSPLGLTISGIDWFWRNTPTPILVLIVGAVFFYYLGGKRRAGHV